MVNVCLAGTETPTKNIERLTHLLSWVSGWLFQKTKQKNPHSRHFYTCTAALNFSRHEAACENTSVSVSSLEQSQCDVWWSPRWHFHAGFANRLVDSQQIHPACCTFHQACLNKTEYFQDWERSWSSAACQKGQLRTMSWSDSPDWRLWVNGCRWATFQSCLWSWGVSYTRTNLVSRLVNERVNKKLRLPLCLDSTTNEFYLGQMT